MIKASEYLRKSQIIGIRFKRVAAGQPLTKKTGTLEIGCAAQRGSTSFCELRTPYSASRGLTEASRLQDFATENRANCFVDCDSNHLYDNPSTTRH